jgi:hypothetical protein
VGTVSAVVVAAVIAAVLVTQGGHSHHQPTAATARDTAASPTTTVPPTRPGPDGITAAWVQAENARPGSPDWRIGAPASPPISGFADHTSAQEGQALGLYVSTTAPTFTATAYRMGWYGGAGARQVWASPPTPSAAQPTCPVDPSTYMVSCPWSKSLTTTITAAWPQGDYLIKLTAVGGGSSYVPLTITDPASTSAYVLINSVLTWQAWNPYGGHSAFSGAHGQQGPNTPDRSRVVSFDRPYDYSFSNGDGASDFIGLELPAVQYAESHGLDVTYLTDIDVTDQPQLLTHHKAVFSLGHNEFWSAPERQALLDAQRAGVNLAFLGATAGLRPARLQPSPLGPDRQEVAYRDATADPIYATQPQLATANEWANPPLDKPNYDVTGEPYGGYDINAPMVVTDPTAWVWAGTGASAGIQLPGVIGGDYDHVVAGEGPPGVRVLASSPVKTSYGHTDTATMSYYTAASGGGVIDTGTITWVGFLTCPTGVACTTVQGATGNIFRVFGTGPAGRDPTTAAA